MNKYNVYQQTTKSRNLELVGNVEAFSGSQAIDLAKQQIKCFKYAEGLARFPIVHQLTKNGDEMPVWIIRQQQALEI